MDPCRCPGAAAGAVHRRDGRGSAGRLVGGSAVSRRGRRCARPARRVRCGGWSLELVHAVGRPTGYTIDRGVGPDDLRERPRGRNRANDGCGSVLRSHDRRRRGRAPGDDRGGNGAGGVRGRPCGEHRPRRLVVDADRGTRGTLFARRRRVRRFGAGVGVARAARRAVRPCTAAPWRAAGSSAVETDCRSGSTTTSIRTVWTRRRTGRWRRSARRTGASSCRPTLVSSGRRSLRVFRTRVRAGRSLIRLLGSANSRLCANALPAGSFRQIPAQGIDTRTPVW